MMNTASAQNLMSDNRQHERHDVKVDVQVVLEDHSFEASSRDLSIGGMRLELGEDAPMMRTGMLLEVAFRLPQLDNEIRVPARVRWVDRIDARVGGVQFLRGLRAVEVWAIDRMRRAG